MSSPFLRNHSSSSLAFTGCSPRPSNSCFIYGPIFIISFSRKFHLIQTTKHRQNQKAHSISVIVVFISKNFVWFLFKSAVLVFMIFFADIFMRIIIHKHSCFKSVSNHFNIWSLWSSNSAVYSCWCSFSCLFLHVARYLWLLARKCNCRGSLRSRIICFGGHPARLDHLQPS